MAREQQKDSQLQDILAGSCPTSLVLQPLPVGQPPLTLRCSDEKFSTICPHFSHPERAPLKIVAERYVWPSMRNKMLRYGLVHAYSTNVQRYFGIQEVRLESSSYLVLVSSMYT
ncbi:hypothetical protein TNCT_728351 [Trichonephila clavata]|uniref:Uncharacterized protein n=1 Tax=Trichonephila clavata TaxID=2740835 RepID=A0A8X6GJM9_TRICU|nr:hypothetical protein TNCT_728351 [Trichonephila clavata]